MPSVPDGRLISRWAHRAPGGDVFDGSVRAVRLDGLAMPANGTPPDSADLRRRLDAGEFRLEAEMISGRPVRDRLWIYMFRIPSGGALTLEPGSPGGRARGPGSGPSIQASPRPPHASGGLSGHRGGPGAAVGHGVAAQVSLFEHLRRPRAVDGDRALTGFRLDPVRAVPARGGHGSPVGDRRAAVLPSPSARLLGGVVPAAQICGRPAGGRSAPGPGCHPGGRRIPPGALVRVAGELSPARAWGGPSNECTPFMVQSPAV